MLTPHHRALFEASYSALLLRSDPRDRPRPIATPPTPPADQPRSKPDSDLRGS
jgi:hypothetical protein